MAPDRDVILDRKRGTCQDNESVGPHEHRRVAEEFVGERFAGQECPRFVEEHPSDVVLQGPVVDDVDCGALEQLG